ncbi:hypothetical protein FRC11_014245 [Ceratobasidium sp. 423]|nr:hypothetical protein FRC11_014245 [Ceratobasidium sp. 423]
MQETIQSLLHERQDKPLAALETLFFNERWWRECLKVCVARHLKKVICQKCLSKGHISVYTSINPNASQVSVAEFQEYTIKCIQEHARRVASYGLAAALFVQSEIESTMAKVWKKMPDGYHDIGLDPQFSEQGDSTGQLDWAELVEDYNLNNLFLGFE